MASYNGLVEVGVAHLPTEIDNLDSPSWTGNVSEDIQPAWGFVPGEIVVRLLDGPREGEVAPARAEAVDDGKRVRLDGLAKFQPVDKDPNQTAARIVRKVTEGK